MSRTRTDCEGFHRRDFLRVGAAGLLGLGLADALRAEALAGRDRRAKKPATGVIQIWLSGRPGDDRHVGPQARRPRGDPRRVPPDRHGRAGGLDLRAHAGAGEGHGPLRPGPFAGPHDHAPTGRARPTWPRATGRAPALEYPALGSLAARLLPPRRGVPPYVTFAALRDGASGRRARATSARRSARSRSRATRLGGRSSRAGVSLPDGFVAPRPGGPRGAAGPVRPRPAGARLHRRDGGPRPASIARPLEILRSDRVRAALDLTREPDRAPRRLRPDAAGPGGPGRPAADRGRGPVRDARLRRLGHARRQLPRPPRPPPARRWTGRSRP